MWRRRHGVWARLLQLGNDSRSDQSDSTAHENLIFTIASFLSCFGLRSNVKPCMQFALSSVRHEPESWFVSSALQERGEGQIAAPPYLFGPPRPESPSDGRQPRTRRAYSRRWKPLVPTRVRRLGGIVGRSFSSGAHSHGVEPLQAESWSLYVRCGPTVPDVAQASSLGGKYPAEMRQPRCSDGPRRLGRVWV